MWTKAKTKQKRLPNLGSGVLKIVPKCPILGHFNYLLASSIATATATVIPTMGLLPAPMRPIISTHQLLFRYIKV